MVMDADFQRRCMPVGTLIDRMDVQPDWCPLDHELGPKQLVWSDDFGVFVAGLPFGAFKVYRTGSGYRAQKEAYEWDGYIGHQYETLDEAKAACQADFDSIWR